MTVLAFLVYCMLIAIAMAGADAWHQDLKSNARLGLRLIMAISAILAFFVARYVGA